MTVFDYLTIALWIAVQIPMLYYQTLSLVLTHRALQIIDGYNSEAKRIGREKLRAQILRTSVIALDIALGVLLLLPLLPRAHGLAVVVIVFYGEFVLLRNTRGDVNLVRMIARTDIQVAADEVVERARDHRDAADQAVTDAKSARDHPEA